MGREPGRGQALLRPLPRPPPGRHGRHAVHLQRRLQARHPAAAEQNIRVTLSATHAVDIIHFNISEFAELSLTIHVKFAGLKDE